MFNIFKIIIAAQFLFFTAAPALAQEDQALIDERGAAHKFIDPQKIKKGQTREEVARIWGSEVVIGYELTDPASRHYRTIVAANPYRSETVTKGKKVFVIDYYLEGIKTPDAQVTNDELLPLVFRDDKLIGMGWDFLTRKIKK